jgi:SAM-dependent methyltransferase
MTINLNEWIEANDSDVDWSLFGEPWDLMQLRHNPFRNEQIQSLLSASGVLQMEQPAVLDLGCGPGILGKLILKQRPATHYVGADSDPLMLAAMRHLLSGSNAQAMLVDLRETDWPRGLGPFDSVVSLTALHWLSQAHQKDLYSDVFGILKEGASFVVGDPYLPEDPHERELLAQLQEQRIQKEHGQTWKEFWDAFFSKYPIRQVRADYQESKGCSGPFEGTDDGYTLAFQMKVLQEAGFINPTVFWKNGLRAVYGGMKPAH